jgi:hypothetical protein
MCGKALVLAGTPGVHASSRLPRHRALNPSGTSFNERRNDKAGIQFSIPEAMLGRPASQIRNIHSRVSRLIERCDLR